MLRHAKLDSRIGANVEDGPCLIRTDSFSGVFTSSPSTVAKKSPGIIHWQRVATGLAMLAMLTIGVTTHIHVQRLEAHLLETGLALREARQALETRDALVTSMLRHVTSLQSELSDNLHALKQAQVDVAARIPSVLAGDIIPQLDRVEAAFDARPSCGFTSIDRVHLNRMVKRLDKVEGQMMAQSQRGDDGAAVKSLLFGKELKKRAAPEQRTTPRLADGLVQVIFGLKGVAVNLFWVDRKGDETKYARIAAGTQVTESTWPGECWRARDAVTGMIRLDYCATIEPSQLVTIEDGTTDKSDSMTDEDLGEVIMRDVFITSRRVR